jgi:hypothetical protein
MTCRSLRRLSALAEALASAQEAEIRRLHEAGLDVKHADAQHIAFLG